MQEQLPSSINHFLHTLNSYKTHHNGIFKNALSLSFRQPCPNPPETPTLAIAGRAYSGLQDMRLSNHNLLQLTEEELLELPKEILRRLSVKRLYDLKEARERLRRLQESYFG